jgi:predicted DNA-binding transcriptional regulator YafY
MTELLDRAVELARKLPADAQDELAGALLRLAGEVDEPPLELSAEEAASLEHSLAQLRRGEYASEAEVRAVWAKHGL